MIAPYGLFELADGRSVLVAVQSDREFRALAETVLHRPELGDDPRFRSNHDRITNVDELEAIIGAAFAEVAADEIIERLVEARVTHSSVREPLDVWNHEQLAARDRKLDVDTETGVATVLKPPFDISGHGELPDRTPALDEHDAELIERLLQRGRARRV